MIEIAGYTDKARRKHNEDSYLVDENKQLYIVADGVGGAEAGEVASALACDVIADEVAAGNSLGDAILTAHSSVLEAAERGEGRQGMATTVVGFHFDELKYTVGWIGDSRAYLWDGRLNLLSRDHSYVEMLYEQGHITLEETNTHPQKNIITQAVGGRDMPTLEVGFNEGTLGPNQVLLLCSDGLTGELDEREILDFLDSGKEVSAIARGLVEAAVDAGGRDNITVIVIRGVADLPQQPAGTYPEVVRAFDPGTGSFSAIGKTPTRAETDELVGDLNTAVMPSMSATEDADIEVEAIPPITAEPKITPSANTKPKSKEGESFAWGSAFIGGLLGLITLAVLLTVFG